MKKGDVVRTYQQWNNPIVFNRFVELIEHQPSADELSLLVRNEEERIIGMPPFVFDEIKHYQIDFPEIDSFLWYDGKLCAVDAVDERIDEITISLPSGEKQALEYPFPVLPYYEQGVHEVNYDGNYLGFIQVVRDKCKYIHVRDSNGDFRKLKRELTTIELKNYNEPRMVLWTAQRWLVKPLVESFPSQLKDDVWFKDQGQCEDLVFDKGFCRFTVNGVEFEEKYNPSDFLVRGNRTTHNMIPFYLTTDSRYSSYSSEWDTHIDDVDIT